MIEAWWFTYSQHQLIDGHPSVNLNQLISSARWFMLITFINWLWIEIYLSLPINQPVAIVVHWTNRFYWSIDSYLMLFMATWLAKIDGLRFIDAIAFVNGVPPLLQFPYSEPIGCNEGVPAWLDKPRRMVHDGYMLMIPSVNLMPSMNHSSKVKLQGQLPIFVCIDLLKCTPRRGQTRVEITSSCYVGF